MMYAVDLGVTHHPGQAQPGRSPAPASAHDARQEGEQALLQALGNRFIQAVLSVGAVGDPYEQEADRIAARVMRMTDGDLPRPPHAEPAPLITIRRQPEGTGQAPEAQEPAPEETEEASPEEDFEPDEEEVLQTKSLGGGTVEAPAGVARELAAASRGYHPLPEPSRRFMEHRIGADFSQVRVHVDDQAARLNGALAARAFTHGRDIYFAPGEYRPGTRDGDLLLAHELAHVVQQSAAPARKILAAPLAGGNREGQAPGMMTPALRVQGSPPIQRSQALYFSTHGRQGYFRYAERFHREKGFPPPVRVGSIEEVLEHMRTLSRPIDFVRIVTHAVPAGIFLPLFRGGSSSLFEQDMQLQSQRALAQELAVEHPTVRQGEEYHVETAEFHVAPRDWVRRAWQEINWTRGGPDVLIEHRYLLSDAPTGERGDQADLDAHSFFWWVLDRELLRTPAVWRTLRPRDRQRLLDLFNRNIAIFRGQLVRGRWGTVESLGRLEAMIVQVAPRLVTPFVQAGFQLRSSLPEDRYRSVQGAVERGTYVENLLWAKFKIANGAELQIRGCRIGQNMSWLETFRDFFGHGEGENRSRPHVSAPMLRHAFGIRSIRRGRRTQVESVEWLQGPRRRIFPGDPQWEPNFAHAR